MIRLIPFAAILLLAGCESEPAVENRAAATPAAGAFDENGMIAQSPAQVEAKARAALAPVLKDPASANFWNLRGEPTGAVCGQVDSKENGKYTGPRPFVVTPEGAALISATPEVGYGDPADPFPDFHIRWCATPEELATVGPAIARREAAPAEAFNEAVPEPAPLPPAELPPPLPAPRPVEAAPPPAPKAAPPASTGAEEDSFSKAVIRKREDSPKN
jgi:hypothetical protein